jgi:hypothetical protein
MRYQRLSEDLQDWIHVTESKRDLPETERLAEEKWDRLIESVAKHIIATRETFLEKPIAALEEFREANPDWVSSMLDGYYTRQQLDRIHDYVDRTMQLAQLTLSREELRIPSEVTRTYLREATRTFIYGMDQACIALCRAAVEQGLKDRLERQGKGVFLERGHLVQEAFDYSYLDANTRAIAESVFDVGDEVLHEKPAKDGSAFDVLRNAQVVLTALFSRTGYLRESARASRW